VGEPGDATPVAGAASAGFRRWHTDAVRDAFCLDPAVTHLNHGSFGAVPRVVAEAQDRARRHAEENPMRFFRVEIDGLKERAREVGAGFLDVGADEVALLRNVTVAASTVLASLAEQGRLGRGDVVVLAESGYESVRRTVDRWCARTGASYVVATWPVDADDDAVVAAFRAAVDGAQGDVRLVVVDAISSPTGALLPASRVCEVAREHGALTMVDAAHVPGHVEARPARSGADFWTGTWHKWGFAPRGTTALWVTEAEREGIQPLTTSWNHGGRFPLPFDTVGTDDYSAWFGLETAVEFWRQAGGLGIGERAVRLLDAGAAVVAEAVERVDVPAPRHPSPCLRLVPLPDGVAATEADADALYERLSASHVEAQVVAHAGRGWIRLSGAVYNEPADYEHLAEVLAAAIVG
jgi:isopenicillin-N epimerase